MNSLEAFVQSTVLPAAGLDAQRCIRVWNDAAQRLLGWSAEEAYSRPFPPGGNLVVDDDYDTLGSAGAAVRTAAGVSEALDAMDSWTPDVLLADIGMPGEDGYALIPAVRQRGDERGGRIAAAALSAYTGSAARQRALTEGYQRYLAKPIDPESLVATVARLGGRDPDRVAG